MAGDLTGICPKSPDGEHEYHVVDSFTRGYHIVHVHQCSWCLDVQET
jgi:hypothetical protein